MAEIFPFRGILYNPARVSNPADVVTPPYDVISRQQQEDFYRRHPRNAIRLILGKKTDGDTPRDNPHTRAAGYYRSWLSEGILVQDPAPAFYLTAVDFYRENRLITRYGVIARVRLEPLDRGIILPHEKTFSRVKSERLALMKESHVNFSPIFSLYPDENGILRCLKEAAAHSDPDMDFVDVAGLRHRLWRITDGDIHGHVREGLADKRLFIADGHHRYETALNYRDWMAAQSPGFDGDHPANFVMMYLCSMMDPGLVVLPAHRILHEIPGQAREAFAAKAGSYFDMASFPLNGGPEDQVRDRFISNLKSSQDHTVIGVCLRGQRTLDLLTLKPGIMERMFAREIPASLRDLDVTVLTRLILMEMLGFDQAGLDNEGLISYSSSEKEAMEAVSAGACDAAFIINPTRIEQVRSVAEEGLIMPRKSTYFYPKVGSGLVLNSLTP